MGNFHLDKMLGTIPCYGNGWKDACDHFQQGYSQLFLCPNYEVIAAHFWTGSSTTDVRTIIEMALDN